MSNEHSIAILLPTRARTKGLTRSVTSMIDAALRPDQIEILFGFDNDDEVGLDHFSIEIQPWLEDRDVSYKALAFESMGYSGLNRYYNALAKEATADWLFVWNDDAVMDTQHWDQVIKKFDGQFKILKVHTHNEHPYSIFPIVPQSWFNTLQVMSRHQMIDAEISQHAYMLDVMQIVDIWVTHEQSELTGTQDSTSARKYRFEGNPNDPRDFHNSHVVASRNNDGHVLAALMKSQNLDTSFFENVWAGQQDPWEKLKSNDINQQCFQFKL